MKLVGGDSGRYEHEEFVDEVLLAPSERAVVDVLLDDARRGARWSTARPTAPIPWVVGHGGVGDPVAAAAHSRSCATTPN